MNSRPLRITILIADLGWISMALWICERASRSRPLVHNLLAISTPLLVSLAVTATLWSLLYFWLKLDGFARGWRWSTMISWLLMGVLFLGAASMLALLPVSGAWLLREVLGVLALLFAGFVLIRSLALAGLWCLGGSRRRIIILGDERVARELAAKIEEHPEIRTQVVGFFSPSENSPECRTVSTLQLVDALKEKSITDMVLVPGPCSPGEMACLVSMCRSAGVAISLVPEHYDLYVNVPRLLNLGGVPLLQIREPRVHPWMLPCKRALDIPLAVLGTVLSLPLLALAATHLHLRRRRALEGEVRCGRNGKTFSLYRLAIAPGDPANTLLMNLLEQTSLTELPQLWNVLRGDMSLVGPRPETPERMQNYSEWHRRRLSVQPGITGWAQVHGLRNGHSSDAKTRFDLHYILHWSPLLDCVILLETIWTMLGRLQRCLFGGRGRKQNSFVKSCSLGKTHAHSAQSSAD
jgi:lipopolysaccharide/colanic/teichoic acid biosynthesis glycosyltransferase